MQFVAYYRVSTTKQGIQGLGIEAQHEAVQKLIKYKNGELLTIFQEVESGSNNERKELNKAMAYCKTHKATLVVAKLDRLARDAKFLLTLADSGVPLLFGDFPDLDGTTSVGRMVLTQMAAVAEFERRRISERICAAMAQAKNRGIKLGGYRGGEITTDTRRAAKQARLAKANAAAHTLLEKIILIDPDNQMSRTKLADELNKRNIETPGGKGLWSTTTITRLLKRVEAIHEQQRDVAAKSVRSVSNRLQRRPRTVCTGGFRNPA
jgi:DNA invertase Pin-like site-specific DNA recombinase